MTDIKSFNFDKNGFQKIKQHNFGLDWPIVYLIEGDKEIYVGQTTSAYNRSNEHYRDPARRELKKIHIITDKEYNVSATLDIESNLIQYISADGKFILQNLNNGLKNHNYFDRQKYQEKFKEIWKKLQKIDLTVNELEQIKNSDLFKYSPYKTLTSEQQAIANHIFKEIKQLQTQKTYVINGAPGTGKTILATYLSKLIIEAKETKNFKIALVVPMAGLRSTLKKVFKGVKGLRANMVISPNEIVKEIKNKKYDLLIVDEAHRLKQRKNITNYKSYDDNNKLLGLNKEANQLDWILKCSKNQILFYDKNQSVHPADIASSQFKNLATENLKLTSQLRIEQDGEEYFEFIQNFFNKEKINNKKLSYDFKIYQNIEKMISDIKIINKEKDICRIVAGYAWPWSSKKDSNKYDIEINNIKLKWNSVNKNWIYSKNAINEVGCIHTVQGYDLNYTGVIIGPEISYNPNNDTFVIISENYYDINGKKGINDYQQLKQYIINIYKTLLTRGIYGTYVYIVDDNLRKYFQSVASKKFLNPNVY